MPTRNEIREIQKAHELFMRAVAPFFEKKASEEGGILETEGLLRVSGDKGNIVNAMENGNFNDLSIHERADVLKKYIEDIIKFSSIVAAKELDIFRKAYAIAPTPNDRVTALKQFIGSLVESGDLEKTRIAEMLYNCIHLGKKVSKHQGKNLMTESNVAIVLGGRFMSLFYSEITDSLKQSPETNEMLEASLNSIEFDLSFSAAYPKSKEIYASAAEDALLSEAKKVVRSRLTSTMARKIRSELLQLKANEEPANFITAAINILKNCPAEKQKIYKKRILDLCSSDFKGVVEKELADRKKEWQKQEYVIDEILKKDAGDITFEEFLRLKKEKERLQNLGGNGENSQKIEHKIQNLVAIKRFSFRAPEPSDDISIKAITWNVGNKEATKDAVDDFISQYFSYDPLPVVIAISTQEELAPTGRCLHEKLLNKLNEGIENEDEKYVLVKYEFHTTTAGANNSAKTLAIATTTDQNRVSSAILVKKPYKMEGIDSRICYEPGKEKGGNKSFIRIKGTVVAPDEKKLDISVTGCHLDSNSDKKRRAHANAFFEGEDLMAEDKDFSKIYKEASSLALIQGDFNERDYLYKDRSTRSNANRTNFQSQGFDFDKDPSIQLNGKPIRGTYGFKFSRDKKQILSSPDPRKRRNVAKGGFLDRIVYSTGLLIKSVSYETKIQPAYFRASKKGKWFQHGSDHLPVIRDVHIPPPTPNASESEKIAIVAAYTEKRLPDYKQEIDELRLLAKIKDADELKDAINDLQYHDSEFTPSQFLKLKYGIDLAGGNLFSKIEAKLKEKEALQKLSEEKRDLLKPLDGNCKLNEKELVHLFNQLTLANKLRDKTLEILADPKVAVAAKVKFMASANQVIDSAHSQAMKMDGSVVLNYSSEMNNLLENLSPAERKKYVMFHSLRQSLVGSRSSQNLANPAPEAHQENISKKP